MVSALLTVAYLPKPVARASGNIICAPTDPALACAPSNQLQTNSIDGTKVGLMSESSDGTFEGRGIVACVVIVVWNGRVVVADLITLARHQPRRCRHAPNSLAPRTTRLLSSNGKLTRPPSSAWHARSTMAAQSPAPTACFRCGHPYDEDQHNPRVLGPYNKFCLRPWAAGVLACYTDAESGEASILLGYEERRYEGGVCLFWGHGEGHEASPRITAARECAEETLGLLGTATDIERAVAPSSGFSLPTKPAASALHFAAYLGRQSGDALAAEFKRRHGLRREACRPLSALRYRSFRATGQCIRLCKGKRAKEVPASAAAMGPDAPFEFGFLRVDRCLDRAAGRDCTHGHAMHRKDVYFHATKVHKASLDLHPGMQLEFDLIIPEGKKPAAHSVSQLTRRGTPPVDCPVPCGLNGCRACESTRNLGGDSMSYLMSVPAAHLLSAVCGFNAFAVDKGTALLEKPLAELASRFGPDHASLRKLADLFDGMALRRPVWSLLLSLDRAVYAKAKLGGEWRQFEDFCRTGRWSCSSVSSPSAMAVGATESVPTLTFDASRGLQYVDLQLEDVSGSLLFAVFWTGPRGTKPPMTAEVAGGFLADWMARAASEGSVNAASRLMAPWLHRGQDSVACATRVSAVIQAWLRCTASMHLLDDSLGAGAVIKALVDGILPRLNSTVVTLDASGCVSKAVRHLCAFELAFSLVEAGTLEAGELLDDWRPRVSALLCLLEPHNRGRVQTNRAPHCVVKNVCATLSARLRAEQSHQTKGYQKRTLSLTKTQLSAPL